MKFLIILKHTKVLTNNKEPRTYRKNHSLETVSIHSWPPKTLRMRLRPINLGRKKPKKNQIKPHQKICEVTPAETRATGDEKRAKLNKCMFSS